MKQYLARVRLRVWLRIAFVVGVFVAVAVALRRELAVTGPRELADALHRIPWTRVSAATTLTLLDYLLLAGYDVLALRYAGARIAAARAVGVSMLSYGLSQTLGFALLTGGAVRARMWSGFGLQASEIAKATAFVGMTFLPGAIAVLGIALGFESPAQLSLIHVQTTTARTLAPLLLLVPTGYVAWAWHRRARPILIGGVTLPVPRPPFAIAQIALPVLDWTVAGLVLRALLPDSIALSLPSFLGLFVIAQLTGIVSQVPGGLGVFEAVMLTALRAAVPAQDAIAALIAYRAIYYLVPFAAATSALVAIELLGRRARSAVQGAVGGVYASALRWATAVQPLLPSVIGTSTFIGGGILLFSGATPALQGRMRLLESVLPLGLIELSHFAASVAGVGLLVVGWGLQRRLDAAWGMALTLLAVAIVASLLKGLDWEEAGILTGVVLVLLPARATFYRRATLTSEPLTPEWIAAVLAVVGASVALGALSYRHVEYSSQLWWQFAGDANAPRFLRATTGVLASVLALGCWRLLRSPSFTPALATSEELARAEAIIALSSDSTPSLALLGDKSLLFSEDGKAFIMYGVCGRSWIALGDPVGPPDSAAQVAWEFRQQADAHGAWPVFYEVSSAKLPLYVDLGMSLMKLGEEAIVHTHTFSVAQPHAKWMRRVLKDAERAGLTFEIVPPSRVSALLPSLRAISDEWLAEKRCREKGFSLGRFDERYLCRFPAAIVRAPGSEGAPRVVAFANVWRGAPGGEVSPDLMRRCSDAPRGVIDFLFVQLLLWATQTGYARVNLGMAPLAGLSGFPPSRAHLTPFWRRAGSFVFGRGEPFYNFQGLRAFKSKFAPSWEPRYLACPNGIVLPRILANVATLIAGGVTGVLRK